ncbi:MAG: BtrH N-terminal domain-containing protein [Chloroflexota bacterium]
MLGTVTSPPEVGALARALGNRLPPELVFGIGGGTGFGRFVYGPQTTLLTRITTRETDREGFLATVCARLGVLYRQLSASSDAALARRLQASIDGGLSPIVWVLGSVLPWAASPASHHAVAVVAIDRDQATVDDGEERRLSLPELLAAAAQAPGAHRRTLVVDGPPQRAIEEAVRDGLRAHLEQMWEGFGPPSVRSKFGLAGLTGWERTVAADNAIGTELGAQVLMRGGGPGMRLAEAGVLELAGEPAAAACAGRAAEAWAGLGEALLWGTATSDEVAAVRDAEQTTLEAIEATLPTAARKL